MSAIPAPDHGKIIVEGTDITRLPARDARRGRKIRFVLQTFLQHLTALNPLQADATSGAMPRSGGSSHGTRRSGSARRITSTRNAVRFPSDGRGLPGSRALADNPPPVPAAEPAVQPERPNGDRVIEFLKAMFRRKRAAVPFAVPDPAVVNHFGRVVQPPELQQA